MPEWNDSLSGDFLWSNTNFGEAVTEVMTPLAWTVLSFTLDEWVFLPGYATVGNIGGYPYVNISVLASLLYAVGQKRRDLWERMEATLYMRLPESLDIPLIPLSGRMFISALWNALRMPGKLRQGARLLPSYLKTNPEWFKQMRTALQAEQMPGELLDLWLNAIAPHVKQGAWCVLSTINYSTDYTIALRRELARLVGPDDANLLIANLSDDTGLLASLGPVAGIAQVAQGELSREVYLDRYGHRGPHEFEISRPRPSEDPAWMDQELERLRISPVDVQALLARQQAAFHAAWGRLQAAYPRKAVRLGKRIDESARRARLREAVRSEYTRDRWLVRLFALRAAELMGLGDDIFFLALPELLSALNGQPVSMQQIAARREAYTRFKALPAYPPIIRGRFDPLAWAADPQRRSDVYAEQAVHRPDRKGAVISGNPGSAGQAEGRARVLSSPYDASQLQPGEILVAAQTDIAWTMLFPRAAAVVTDVGAPLSHAAIVARELGIPAVVGCGDATTRLKSGDRVRVDGGAGTVTIIEG